MRFSILFGGASHEHEISIVSAIALTKVLKEISHCIFLDSEGNFYHIPLQKMRSDTFSAGMYKKAPRLTLGPGGFSHKSFWGAKRLDDLGVVINLIHGAQGEDGMIASLLDFYKIPYLGPRLEASAIGYNKWFTKLYAEGVGIPTIQYQKLTIDGPRAILVDYPLIVKPCRLGSSIGVGIVRNEAELEYALDVAFEFDHELLVEPFIEGVVEYNVAGAKVGKEWVFGRIEQPKKKEFLDFEQKYLDFSRTESVHEAKIDAALANDLKEAFKKVYAELFEGAIVRCDFFFFGGKIFLNEINPIPGSLANYLFEDFNHLLQTISSNLPSQKTIRSTYSYIQKVQSAKGPKLGRNP